ncbi:MAG: (2Fe-2S)-binding protein [bacterium]|nr:(2Fe-2S)-binding protein [bacterium]MCP5092025.1 (2Fe-2S)-binding protein [Gammaproteobacteria bacterium]
MSFTVNDQPVTFEGDDDTPLLWVLRDHLRLTGTKYSCGLGLCGACVVHLDGDAAASCRVPVASLEGRSVTTIEGLAPDDDGLHAVQKAWLELDVAQCGYCQSGQIMAAVEFLERYPAPSDADIDDNLSSMLCRCGTYARIRKAIHRAAEIAREEGRRG